MGLSAGSPGPWFNSTGYLCVLVLSQAINRTGVHMGHPLQSSPQRIPSLLHLLSYSYGEQLSHRGHISPSSRPHSKYTMLPSARTRGVRTRAAHTKGQGWHIQYGKGSTEERTRVAWKRGQGWQCGTTRGRKDEGGMEERMRVVRKRG